MSRVDDAAFGEFFTQWYPRMVRIGLGFGASRLDAEDAASVVAIRIWRSWQDWTSVEHRDAYLSKAMINELSRAWKKRAAQRVGEMQWTQDMRWFEPRDTAADAYDRVRELDGVHEWLAIAPQRQREIMTWLYLRQRAGWQVAEIATALGISPATIRSQRRHVRRLLEPFLVGEGHEHRRWLRAGERIHQDFHSGHAGPLGPRPIILDAWTLLRKHGLQPERGTRVVILDQSELQQRRQQSQIPAGSPVLAELNDLAVRNGLLAVVLNDHSHVLHRGGHRNALAAADRLGFVDGACWDLRHAGVNAAGLVQILGVPVTVNRWEHSYPDQHGLNCIAIPLRIPHGGHITVNLTTTDPGLTSVPQAIHHQLHTIALRLYQQLSVTFRATGSAP